MKNTDKDNDYKYYLTRAMNYCSKGEHCITEVERKLFDWKAPGKYQNKIIESLLEQDFINHERYARFFVADKFRFNKWGKMKLQAMLQQKGIDNSLILQSLRTINQEEYYEVASQLLKAKAIKYPLYSFKEKAAVFRYMQSKGYEYDIIDCAWDDFLKSRNG